MKNVIYNFYGISLDEINKDGKNFYFYLNNDYYVFYFIENDTNVVEYIYNYLVDNKIDVYEIIKTKENKLFVYIDNKIYSLLRIIGIHKYEIKFEELKFYPVDKLPVDWGKLWSERLDYYELQIRELGYNYQTVLNSFGMFSGLAENAILYYNLSSNKFNDKKIVGIVHNRMKYPCYLIDYNNPLNMIVDYNIRDIGEYIKSYIFSEEYQLKNVLIILERLNLNNLMFNLLYARLLYPTFYFDVFDDVILSDGKDNDVVCILDRLDVYLDTLRIIYYKFKDRYNMLNIEWLFKKMSNH